MSAQTKLPLNPLDRIAIECAITRVLRGRKIGLKLYGSRARGDARQTSDIDLALMAEPGLVPGELAEIREALEDSRIPYRVDLVDYADLPDSLRTSIDREGIAWRVPTNA